MLSKNLNKPRSKPGVITVALLGLLLGVQIAAFADLQYDYNYGFNRCQDVIRAEGLGNISLIVGYYNGACYGKFSPSSSDVYACDNGGQVALNQAIQHEYGG
jgi:hypothetical protein